MLRYLLVRGGKVHAGTGMCKNPGKGELLFLLATAPGSREAEGLAKQLGVSRNLFRDYGRAPYSRRLSTIPFTFLLKDYYIEKGEINTADLIVTLDERILAIVSAKDSGYYAQLFTGTKEKLENRKPKHIVEVMYDFLLEDTEDNYAVLEKTEQELSAMENHMVSGEKGSTKDVQHIITLKRRLFRMSRQFSAAIKIISALRTGSAHIRIDQQSMALLNDLHEAFLHQIDVASAQRDMASDLLSINSTNISNNLAERANELNIIMKRLAAFALLLMLPTLMTGIYGMNFAYLPLAQQHSGIYILLASMLGTMMVTIVFFKKAKWL